MTWIKAHQSLINHRKTLKLARLLHTDKYAIVGKMVALWCWAIDNAPQGIIKDDEIDALLDVMGIDGEIEPLITAITSAGFIERVDEGWRIHNWEEYGGKFTTEREQTKQRQRTWRQRQKERTQEVVTEKDSNALLTRESRSGNALDQIRSDLIINTNTINSISDVFETNESKTEESIEKRDPTPPKKRERAKPTFDESTDAYQLANMIAKDLYDSGVYVPTRTPAGLAAWSKALDTLMNRDPPHTRADIEAVWTFAHTHQFWEPIITNMAKFFKNFDQMNKQRKRDTPHVANTHITGQAPARATSQTTSGNVSSYSGDLPPGIDLYSPEYYAYGQQLYKERQQRAIEQNRARRIASQ